MGRAIRRLRAEGQLAAVIDLTQISTRSESVDSARWHYSIAYRISRELRLKVDLQAWWHERGMLLNEQRLVEFFLDIVLANTEVPVTIFFDEAERAVELAFASELFAALHSCYMRRVSEPDFSRLNFVVFGAASPGQLCPDPDVSVFAAGVPVQLEDFSVEECLTLATGLGQPEAVSRAIIERIYRWTHGQPYLTQKLARGIARRGGNASAADVDAVAQELFLAPGVSRGEPYLNHMRTLLTDGSLRGRQARAMLGRLAKGGELIYDPVSAAQQLLHVGGFVSSDENGMLRFRNRIVEQVFDNNWSRSVPDRHWQRPARFAAVLAALLVVLPYWYLRILPRPYIDTLAVVSSDLALATQAHERLGRLPGFGRRADQMLTDVLARLSAAADSIEQVQAADAILRELPEGNTVADRLMADFWLRLAVKEAHRGERDAALIHAIAAVEGGSDRAVGMAANLIDGDYPHLAQSFQINSPVVNFEVDWDRGQIVVVDESQRILRLPLDAGSPAAAGQNSVAARSSASPFTALQQIGVTRGFFVDEPGRAGALQLRLTVEHGRTSDLLLRLRAPSGAAAEVALRRRDGTFEQFVFTASAENGLLRLADESLIGQWELTVFDRLSGESGRLVSWGLSFPGVPQSWDDDPVDGIALPDPLRTEQVTVLLAENGQQAIALPSRADARGAASVWDLGSGTMIGDVPLADRASLVRLIGEDKLLVGGPVRAMLWRVGSAEPLAEIVTTGGFAAPPVVSPDSSYLAIAESLGEQSRVSVHAIGDGRLLGRFDTDRWQDWALAAGAEYLAVTDGSRRGRLLNPLTGQSLAEFFHDRDLARVIAARGRVVAVDNRGDIYSWQIDEQRQALTPADSVFIGTAGAVDGIQISNDGALLSFVDASGLAHVVTLGEGYRQAVFDHGGGRARGTRIGPGANRLVTVAGSRIRSWRLPEDRFQAQDFGDLSAVAISASGSLAAMGFRSGKVQWLTDLPDSLDQALTPEVDYFGHRSQISTLAVNGSNTLIASGASDGLVRVWDVVSGSPRRYLLRHPEGPVSALAFSPDDRWLVSGAAGSARVFDLESGERVNEIEVDGSALAVAIAPDSRLVAVGDSSGNIVLASPDGTQGILTIRGRSPITALNFGGTPNLLVSGSSDGSLVFWDTLEASASEGAIRFTAPIHWIRTASESGEVLLQSGGWLHRLQRGAGEAMIVASNLLPSHFRVSPALAATTETRIRALAQTGGGRLAVTDVVIESLRDMLPGEIITETTSRGSGVPNISRALVAGRDWNAVLGLEIDPLSGFVESSGP